MDEISNAVPDFSRLPARYAKVTRLLKRTAVGVFLLPVVGMLSLRVLPGAMAVALATAAALCILAWFGVGAVAYCYWLLCPRSYLLWLRQLPPHEPLTFWGQTLGDIADTVRGTGGLIVGGYVGAVLATAKTPMALTSASTTMFLVVAPLALIVFASARALIRLYVAHLRGFERGELPLEPGATSCPNNVILAFTFFIAWILVAMICAFALHAVGQTTGQQTLSELW